MSDLEVYHEVQAALLNSSCKPTKAISAALRATVEFADRECDLSENEVVDLIRAAWQARDAG